MNCVICFSAKKYKCKQCNVPYCSVPCYKKHTQSCDGKIKEEVKKEPSIVEDPVVKTDYVSDEELRLSHAQLERLSQSTRIKNILKEPILREKLIAIDNSKQRMTTVQ